jgi:ubiquitin C-terminal hydrolase
MCKHFIKEHVMKRLYIIGLISVLLIPAVSMSRPPALANIGNTCFANALTQNMYNIPELTNMVMAKQFNTDLLQSYKNLIGSFNQQENKPDLIFKNELRSFVGSQVCPLLGARLGQQQDAHEMLGFMIDALAKDMQRLFITQYEQKTACMRSEYISKRDVSEPFISLPFAGESLPEALLYWSEYQPEDFRPGKDCYIKHLITDAPDYLILHLKRYKVELEKKDGQIAGITFPRIKEVMEAPLTLNLNFLLQAGVGPINNYELIGVVVHTGQSIRGGHYYAYIKDQYEKNPLWYRCDDVRITSASITSNEVQADIERNGYLFFYKRMGQESVVQQPAQEPDKPDKPGKTEVSADMVQSLHMFNDDLFQLDQALGR